MHRHVAVLLVSGALLCLCLWPGAALSQDAPTFDIPAIAVPAIEVPSVPSIEFAAPSGTSVDPPVFLDLVDQVDLEQTIENLLAAVQKALTGFGDSTRARIPGGTP